MSKTPFVQGYEDTIAAYEKNRELPENPYKETDFEYGDYTRGMTYASQVLLKKVVDRISDGNDVPTEITRSMNGLKTSFDCFADMQDKYLNNFNGDASDSTGSKEQYMANIMFACDNIQKIINNEVVNFPYPDGYTTASILIKAYKTVIDAFENNELDDIDDIINIKNNFELSDEINKFEYMLGVMMAVKSICPSDKPIDYSDIDSKLADIMVKVMDTLSEMVKEIYVENHEEEDE